MTPQHGADRGALSRMRTTFYPPGASGNPGGGRRMNTISDHGKESDPWAF